MDFLNINGRLDIINLNVIQNCLNSIKTKFQNVDIILPKNDHYFFKIKQEFYSSFL